MQTLGGREVPETIAQPLARFLETLRKRDPEAKVFLCGSYARGDWLKDSDVDLIVVSRIFSKLDVGKRFVLVKKLMGPGCSLDLLAFTPKEFGRAAERSMIVEDMLVSAVEL